MSFTFSDKGTIILWDKKEGGKKKVKSFYLKPKFFSVIKNYTAKQFANDAIAGVIVAIIALPRLHCLKRT